uniref:Thymidylate synthase n=1 Tax=Heterorhabditis bacteriophora TaxID=37862 RepID=A0A1I7XKP2_HETBA
MENNDEYKYLEQIKEILENGKERTDRTGVGTISIFGMQNRYCLRDDLKQMALPPCHTLCQFFVQDGELSCQLYQRSGDMAGELVHTLGDAHIYKNHIDALKAQLERTPCAFPTVHFSEEISEIDDFTSEKIILKNYCPQAPIKMDMAV